MSSLDFSKLKDLRSFLPGGPAAAGEPLRIALDLIDEDPEQPRKEFGQAALEELAETIRENGVLQPILLRPAIGGRYVITAGTRRFRAARLAGLSDIPATVRDQSEGTLRDVQVIENVQRADLQPHEVAAYIESEMAAGKSQAAIAKQIGKSRTYVNRYCKFLTMPAAIRRLYDVHHIADMHIVEELVRAHDQNPAAIDAFCGAINEPVTRSLIAAYLARQTVPSSGPTVREFDSDSAPHTSDEPNFDSLPDRSAEDDALRRDETTPTFNPDEINRANNGEGGDAESAEAAGPADDAKPRGKKWAVLVKVGKDHGRVVLTGPDAPGDEEVMIAFQDGTVSAVPAGRVKLIGSEPR